MSSLPVASPDRSSNGWRSELARAQPELAHSASTNAGRAASWLAVVLGHCRLRAIELGDLDGSLSVPLASRAAEYLLGLLARWRVRWKRSTVTSRTRRTC